MKNNSDKKNIPRLAAVSFLIAVSVFAFTYGIAKLISAESGFRTIECTANAANCSDDFIFTYQLGVSEMSPTAELKAVTNLYNEKAAYYYRLFHASEQFDDIINVASINASPNTELTLTEDLYESLEKAVEDKNRSIFLAPIFAYYDTLFASSFDEDAATWDPQKNAQLNDEYQKTLSFISDDEHIHIEFKGNNSALLYVSKKYLAYADEVGIQSFIDFNWLKNAFIADLLADDFTNAGFVYGAFSSRDGFIRNIDPSETEYAFDFFDEKDGILYAAGKLTYTGSAAICSLHPFVLDDAEQQLLYEYTDGRRVTRYISLQDALPHGTSGAVTVFSKEYGCADLLLSVLPFYLSEDLASYSPGKIGIFYSYERIIYELIIEGFKYTKT